MDKQRIAIRPEGKLAMLADKLLRPVMYLAAGTIRERPQEGHPWNKKTLSKDERALLDKSLMVHCSGSSGAFSRLFQHLPILGGWREYIVLAPRDKSVKAWHVGWYTVDTLGPMQRVVCGVRRWVLPGPARLLIGPNDVSFFGIAAEGEKRGEQIAIEEMYRDRIGNLGPFSHLPLG